jgi:hypothetical protein
MFSDDYSKERERDYNYHFFRFWVAFLIVVLRDFTAELISEIPRK